MKLIRIFLFTLITIGTAVPKGSALPTGIFTDGPGITGGGEFNATTTANGSFITFCLKASEHLSLGITYYYTISREARYNGTTSTLDPLSRPTAWLHLQFLDGTLGSFGYCCAYSNSKADANDLQKSLWHLENESGGVNNYYAQLAIAQAGPANVDNNGFNPVGVMNLWLNQNETGARQDQLIRLPIEQQSPPDPVPDGGSAMLLLGFAPCFLPVFSGSSRFNPQPQSANAHRNHR